MNRHHNDMSIGERTSDWRKAKRPVPRNSFAAVLLEILSISKRPVGAYDLADRVSHAIGYRVYPNSVYRALTPLVADGIVLFIASRKAYLFRDQQIGSNPMITCCKDCGAVVQRPLEAIEKKLTTLCKERGFAPTHFYVEVLGRCPCCAGS